MQLRNEEIETEMRGHMSLAMRTEHVGSLATNSASLAHVLGGQRGTPAKAPAAPMVFVVDDDASARESLGLLIRREGWQSETFPSAQAFLARPRTSVPSCLVLEVSVRELNGLDLQRRLAVERPDISIISIAQQIDVPMAVQAIKAGAFEFFAKPIAEDLLVATIREALEHSRFALKREAEIQGVRNCYASLSRRERQVMDLLVAGLLNKQVGGELGISEHTVKVHRGRVMQKMQADSFAQLVRMSAKIDIASRPESIKPSYTTFV